MSPLLEYNLHRFAKGVISINAFNLELKEEQNHLFWAKSDPYKSLSAHMIETGAVAQTLMTEGCFSPLSAELEYYTDLPVEEVVALSGYLAAIHDIGKLHPAFIGSGAVPEAAEYLQKHGLEVKVNDFRHEKYGALCVYRIWKEKKRFPPDVAFFLRSVIRLHHQGKCGSDGKLDDDKRYIWEKLQNNLEERIWKLFQPPNDFLISHIDAVCTLLLAVVLASDWIASSDAFSFLQELDNDTQVLSQAKQVTKNFLWRNEMLSVQPPRIKKFTDLWPDIPQSGMRPLQCEIEKIFQNADEKPLAIILEAPMGEGKTEAAMYAASQLAPKWGKEGFYIGLPTMATSNQMFRRMNRMLDRQNFTGAKLMHAMAWLMDTEPPYNSIGECEEQAQKWTAPLRKGLIAPFAVGTVDQAMMAALPVKYGALRIAGLTEKVLIIDECHAYDSYMSGILVSLLKWCRALHIPAILLSATLPYEKKAEFMDAYHAQLNQNGKEAYPCITLIYENGTARQVPVNGSYQHSVVKLETLPILSQIKGIAHLAAERLEQNGGCLCVLLNTVKEAQEVWEEIHALLPNEKVILFHARFNAGRRKELEDECDCLFGPDKSQRPKRAILVATEVVEQSLDLDFDTMITAICPIDFLFQRLGRMWRHKSTPRPAAIKEPKLTVLFPDKNDYGPSAYVYADIILERTQDVLKGRSELKIPQDIPVLVEEVYRDGNILSEQMKKWYENRIENEVKLNAAKALAPGPDPDNFAFEAEDPFFSDEDTSNIAARTRLSEPSVRLALLPRTLFQKAKAESRNISRNTAKRVLYYSFTVPENQVAPYLKKTFRDGTAPVTGTGYLGGLVMVPAENGICLFTDGTVFRMDPLRGFIIQKGDGKNGI